MTEAEKKYGEIAEEVVAKEVAKVSFLSGKGGVGKTTFSVNLAKILSDGSRVLLVDCDITNRGASTLLLPKVEDKDRTLYAMLCNELKWNGGKYEKGIQMIDENLFFLPSTATGQLIDWIDYKTEFEDLKNALSNIIESLVNEFEIDCIVFDCRPGPDPLSGAAASISDFVILMTEADKVTFDGTMHLRLYLSEKYNVKENVYFVVNRVPEKYSVLDLNYIYSKEFLEFLQILQVLSNVPFEFEVFESLGEEKFVVEQFPRSILSSKLYVLAYDLFNKRFPHLITPRINAVQERYSEKFRETTKFGFGEQSYIPISISLMVLGVGILLIRRLTLLEDLEMAEGLASIYGAFIIVVFIVLFSRRFSKSLKRRRRTF